MLAGNSSSEEPMVTAKYDYKARDADELDLIKNEKLILLDDTKTWWRVNIVLVLLKEVVTNMYCSYGVQSLHGAHF